MLSMKKSHEYVRLFQAIIKVGKFAHFYKSAYIEAKREGKVTVKFRNALPREEKSATL